MNDPRSDDDLMLAYGQGDSLAFEVLYERYRQPLYRYVFHALGDPALADDAYQDIWSRIIDARERFRRKSGFRRWAFRIAHNRLVDHWRLLERQPVDSDEVLDRHPDRPDRQPEQRSEQAEQAAGLRRALMALPPEQREAFLLQQEAGLSLAEIAERDGVGRETVKSRLRYAVGKLRTLLAPSTQASGP
jgi:RNA polymerase sigma-70 factor (ECF subfamily)